MKMVREIFSGKSATGTKRNHFLLVTGIGLTFCYSVILGSSVHHQAGGKLKYPVSKKVDQVDTYAGVTVKDPYRWLEDDQDPQVKAWVAQQNRVTDSYLAKIPFRQQIRERLQKVNNYPKLSQPFKVGDYYFFYKNNGLQNQSVIYVQKGLTGKPEIFMDPNLLSRDGTITAFVGQSSHDKRYISEVIQRSGSDSMEIRVIEIASKKELPDRIQMACSSATWHGQGFYYSAYGRPEKGKELTARYEFMKIFFHELGSPQDQDRLVCEDKENPLRSFSMGISDDERYLFLYSNSAGVKGDSIYYRDLKKGHAEFIPLVINLENESYIIDNINEKFLLFTNCGAPNNRVVLVDPQKPSKENWKTIIPEKPENLESCSKGAGKLFLTYLKDATAHVYQYDYAGKLEHEIQLPALGDVSGFYGHKDDQVLFYTFSSFVYPPTIFKYDPKTGKSELFQRPQVPFSTDNLACKQVFFESKDKTKIPLFLVYKNGLKLDGSNPLFLYGYGGFSVNMAPYFSSSLAVLLENGFVYGLVILRGGSEYGEDWHKAGMLLNKQNVFDDFIAAAEYLIREKYTSAGKIAMNGASNGGLLVGACMTQRPDLFKVALPDVGVMDMLRYQKFTGGWYWVQEYGNSEDPAHFKNLYSYSPYHNIKPGARYPATLVTTADHDDRVVPAHSFKFIAALQAAQQGDHPVLIRVETKSGHGSSNLTKRIDMLTDQYSFMFYNLGVKYKKPEI